MASTLSNLSPEEWENLCDGCGRCCLVKLEDETTGDVLYTNVVCRFLDMKTCRCTDYPNRSRIQPECVQLSPRNLSVLAQMPWTCAYRLVHEGRILDQNPEVLPVSGKVVSEEFIHELQLPDHIVDWVKTDRSE